MTARPPDLGDLLPLLDHVVWRCERDDRETVGDCWFSPSVGRLLGLPPGDPEPSLDRWLAAVHPDDRAAAAAIMTGCVTPADRQAEPPAETQAAGEFRLISADGGTRQLRAKARNRVGADGRRVTVGVLVDLTDHVRRGAALAISEATMRRWPAAVVEPVDEPASVELADLIDVPTLQAMLEDFHRLTGIGGAIIDLKGQVLVSYGWQEICVRFHRRHPETLANCVESDVTLASGVAPGTWKAYRCKNHLWDIASPIEVANRHVGNVFFGQFFFADEAPDREVFRAQARRYGFPETEYLAALDRVLRLPRETVETVMHLFTRVAGFISQLSYRALELGRAVAQRGRAERLLTTQNRELEQIVHVASHDLRSPLVNVEGYSRELQRFLAELERLAGRDGVTLANLRDFLHTDLPDANAGLSFIRNSARQMEKLLTGLAKLSRAGRAALKLQIIDMNRLVAAVAGSLEYQARQAGTTVRIEPLPPCYGDEVQVTQVFSNLLGNALKFLDPARPGCVAVTGHAAAGRAIYQVEDNGIGIAPEHQAKIFRLFERLDPSRASGDGLGLPIVAQALARLEGEIRVDSKLGEGSRFTVVLPCAKPMA